MTQDPHNPFQKAITQQGALGEVEKTRAVAEIQAAMVIARQFRRDEIKAQDRILNACTRPGLAEGALYTYSRGGTEITGPSIRLAEVLAQNWENIQFGTKELEQRDGESTMETFAWDLETNVKQIKTFQVKHERHTKSSVTKLTDPRDIYETTANVGARRLRACILGIIPGDVIEAAVKQCEVTLKSKAEVTPESLAKLTEAFATHGVTKQQIEKRIQRHLDSMLPAQLVSLRKIFNSLKDGMSTPADWFDAAETIPDFEKPKKGEKSKKEAAPKSDPLLTLKGRLLEHAVEEKVFCQGLELIGRQVGDVESLDELPSSLLKDLAGMDMIELLDTMEAKSQEAAAAQ